MLADHLGGTEKREPRKGRGSNSDPGFRILRQQVCCVSLETSLERIKPSDIFDTQSSDSFVFPEYSRTFYSLLKTDTYLYHLRRILSHQ